MALRVSDLCNSLKLNGGLSATSQNTPWGLQLCAKPEADLQTSLRAALLVWYQVFS